MKLILRCIKRHLGSFLTALLFLSVEAMADLLQPTFMSHIVDEGVKGADVGLILRYGLIMLGIAALGAFGAVMRNRFCKPYLPDDWKGTAQRYVPQGADAFS